MLQEACVCYTVDKGTGSLIPGLEDREYTCLYDEKRGYTRWNRGTTIPWLG